MTTRSSSATHVGLVRTNNEDALFADDALATYAVADGMGGHAAGELASQIAVDAVAWYARKYGERLLAEFPGAAVASHEHLHDAMFAAAHRDMLSLAAREPRHAGLGTTLTACAVADGLLWVAHVGDSALYVVRGGRAEKLTENHVGHRHHLTNCLGNTEGSFRGAQHAALAVLPGDRVVLATDGVTDCTSATEIASLVAGDLAGAAARLVAHALERGGHDNATAVVVEVLP